MPETDSDPGLARFQAIRDRGEGLPPAWQMSAPVSKIGILALLVVAVAGFAALIGSLMVG
jgi:hypothetical protein